MKRPFESLTFEEQFFIEDYRRKVQSGAYPVQMICADACVFWDNFREFLAACKDAGIRKIYLTGQNMDSLQYPRPHLMSLIQYLKDHGFSIGIRTNGLLAPVRIPEILACNDEIGYTINSLDTECNVQTMGPAAAKLTKEHWEWALNLTQCRVSTVVHRYNMNKVLDLTKFLSEYPTVAYHQLRRVSTDHRYPQFQEDIEAFEELAFFIERTYPMLREFYGAPIYKIHGKEVSLWRTVETSINSFNYFTDGTWSKEYFVVEGYEKARGLTSPKDV
ncbi:Uncharacterised protein [uncultured archaeon]|nr:Uncharacterised protein [uncultured archaeon]